jgi:hypothetical protein
MPEVPITVQLAGRTAGAARAAAMAEDLQDGPGTGGLADDLLL